MKNTIAAPHTQSPDQVAKALAVDLQDGLSGEDAKRRFADAGPNELEEKGRRGFLSLLAEQFNNFLIIVLIAAATVSFLVGEPVDAIAILVIVVLNAVMGVVQESKAERALEALKQMSAPEAQVLRDGEMQTVPVKRVVPGDVVLLEAGSSVPADLRLLEAVNLRIDEAPLTGESVPVKKRAKAVLEEKASLGDRENCAFMGTTVSYGRGRGVVTATGMDTEMGKIATMIQSYEEEETPLQRRLSQLGKWLGIIALAICGVIFLYGVIRDTQPALAFQEGFAVYFRQYQQDIVELFMTAVSLAIAAVPEGLPAVVTICLALGMQRMVRRHALIRKLPAVETLGTATVICTDKTGTLTQNRMTVVKDWVPDRTVELDEQDADLEENPRLSLLLHGGLLCNDASLQTEETEGGESQRTVVGDPTEGALVMSAVDSGLDESTTKDAWPRRDEFPFTSERKRMTTIHTVPDQASFPDWGHGAALTPGRPVAFMKGAPDVVLNYCNRMLAPDQGDDAAGSAAELDADARDRVLAANSAMAQDALRVLAVAYKPLEAVPEEDAGADEVEQEFIFVGLAGMIDPPREEAIQAVQVAERAGIRTVMVTGDYKETAAAIAAQIGIIREGGEVLSGAEIDQIDDEEFGQTVEEVDAYARVSPEHKVRILQGLRWQGHVAAMTGDGVNDAPALKRADIGVAMGITGTDVSKQTSEMVLTDDNFASIVSAVEEGRVIYSNIRKFVYYLISCNIGEILIIFTAMIAGLVIPLTPIMILFLNLVTDGAPALALGVEKGDPDIMKRPPRPPHEPIINAQMRIGLLVQAIAMTVAVLGVYLIARNRYPDQVMIARGIAFATLVLSELWRAFTARSERYSIFQIGPASNRWMLVAVASSLLLLVGVIYLPFLHPVFDTTFLSLEHWLLLLPFTLVAAVAAEITKIFLRRKARSAFREAA